MKYIIICVCIIFLLFLYINKIIQVQENYLTYFLPFYNVESNLLRDFYVNEDNNKNYFKSKMIYNKFYFIGNNDQSTSTFLNDFSSRVISKTNIVNTNVILTNSLPEVIDKLKNNDNIISLINLPQYLSISNTLNNSNVRLISNLYKKYLLILTQLKYNIHSIYDININTTIGILKQNSIFYYYENFFNDINKPLKKENVKIYESFEDLTKGFLNNEIEVILFFKELPSVEVNDLLNQDYENQIIILPFKLPPKINTIFQKKHDYTQISYFDLNKIVQKYLPKKFGNEYYFVYKPDIQLLSISEYLICSKNLKDSIAAEVFNFIIQYRNVYRNTSYEIPLIEPSYNLIKYIQYHTQILKEFRKKGYITNIDSENCSKFVGVKECTKKVLENNGLYDK